MNFYPVAKVKLIHIFTVYSDAVLQKCLYYTPRFYFDILKAVFSNAHSRQNKEGRNTLLKYTLEMEMHKKGKIYLFKSPC
jgi:hypothetical protein